VKANNSSRGEVAVEMKRIFVKEVLFQQPTAEEVSRLVFGKLRDLRVHAQEARDQFAHLLNRGSCLE